MGVEGREGWMECPGSIRCMVSGGCSEFVGVSAFQEYKQHYASSGIEDMDVSVFDDFHGVGLRVTMSVTRIGRLPATLCACSW